MFLGIFDLPKNLTSYANAPFRTLDCNKKLGLQEMMVELSFFFFLYRSGSPCIHNFIGCQDSSSILILGRLRATCKGGLLSEGIFNLVQKHFQSPIPLLLIFQICSNLYRQNILS